MTYENMYKSCEIFMKYDIKNNYFDSDYDIIYGPDLETPFTEDECKELENLGWWKNDNYDCWCC